jgi:hypothetical protein
MRMLRQGTNQAVISTFCAQVVELSKFFWCCKAAATHKCRPQVAVHTLSETLHDASALPRSLQGPGGRHGAPWQLWQRDLIACQSTRPWSWPISPLI